LLLIPSLPQEIQLFKTYITIPCHFDDPLNTRKRMCCSAACSSKRDIQNWPQKKTADISCWFWLKYRKCCKTFWATLVCIQGCLKMFIRRERKCALWLLILKCLTLRRHLY
jgi:hypothetical protein